MCSGGREHGLKLRRDLGTRWKVKFSSALLGLVSGVLQIKWTKDRLGREEKNKFNCIHTYES